MASDAVGDEFTKSFASALRIRRLCSNRCGGTSVVAGDRPSPGVARNGRGTDGASTGYVAAVASGEPDAVLRVLEASTGTWRPLPGRSHRDAPTPEARCAHTPVGTGDLQRAPDREPSGLFGRDHLGADRDGVLVTPTAVGAEAFWWSQTADEISLGVGESTRWVVARDDSGVAVVRHLADAVVFGRVEIGEVHAGGHRVWLADGTILEDPCRQPLPADPTPWTGRSSGRGRLRTPAPRSPPAGRQRMTRRGDRPGLGPLGSFRQFDAELGASVVAYLAALPGGQRAVRHGGDHRRGRGPVPQAAPSGSQVAGQRDEPCATGRSRRGPRQGGPHHQRPYDRSTPRDLRGGARCADRPDGPGRTAEAQPAASAGSERRTAARASVPPEDSGAG